MQFTAAVIFLLIAFSSFESSNNVTVVEDIQTDSTKKWISDFKSFRDAVYRDDTAVLKSFFKFPVLNPGDEIWYWVLTEKEKDAKNLTAKITPFTEADFNKYYKKLFPKEFVKTLLKIKSAELLTKGETESPEIKDSTTAIKMYASLDKTKKILSLNLSYKKEWKEENGEVTDGGESTAIYSFRILKNGHLQFMYVRLAG